MVQEPDGPVREVELADGTRVDLLPMVPGDAAGLRRFHRTLSDATTYLRFFAVHRDLSAREVERFTHVDHRDREAVTARVGGEIVGVARFERLKDATEAEVAFVVADGWQGRGLGSAMFADLVERAIAAGVRTLVADTLAGNARMLAVFRHAGLPVSTRIDGSVLHLRMDLAAGR